MEAFWQVPARPLQRVIRGSNQVLRALANQPLLARKPFYYIRHGQTDVNADPNIKRVDYDLPLNNQGKMQAQAARNLIAAISPRTVCHSPVQRAVETKDILVSGLNAELIELESLGECKAYIWTQMVEIAKGRDFPVCDQVKRFLKRALKSLRDAQQYNDPTLLVSHGGIHWALCYLLRIENHPWKIGNCELVRFRPVQDSGWEAEIIRAW